MKKIIQKISGAIQVILMTPVKLPNKVLNIIKYIGLGLGIIESVIVEKDKSDEPLKEDRDGEFAAKNSNSHHNVSSVAKSGDRTNRLVKYHLETGEEVIDETE